MTDQFFGISDTGRERKNNEDTFIAGQAAGNQFIIACVIDGVGGYAGGEIAAEITRNAFIKRLEQPSGDVISMLINCFDKANEGIIKEKKRNKEYENMSCVCTLALVDIANNQFYYAHVGDTRLYLLRDGSLVKISHDQSFVGFLEESGRLTEKEAMNHPKRNEINKALGFEPQLVKNTDYIETGQSPFLSGDLLLLCSDGLTDMVTSAKITDILTENGTLKEKGNLLISAANHHGGKDNVTVVLVQNDKTPLQHPAAITKQREQAVIKPQNSIADEPVSTTSDDLPKAKSSTGIIATLSILMLIFLTTSVYFYLQSQKPDAVVTPVPVLTVERSPNPQEIKLQKAIDNVKGNVLILSDTGYKAPVIISKAIAINKDSLTIKARGKISFQSDSGYTGPAFVLSAKCKSVVLDSLSFNNFDVGISFTNITLTLKNVRFVNCKQGVQNQFAFAHKNYISGKFPALVLRSDSLPVINK